MADHEFFEYPYRWVIVSLVGIMFLINGLLNNTVIPIAARLAEVYDLSDAYVSSPVTVSFLVYTVMNFPANHVIDTKGLRFSFLIGAGLYMSGAALYTMVNKSYIFPLFGAILVAIGQPFIINVPAKIATYWFFDSNVTRNSMIETICNFCDDWAYANRYRIWICAPNPGSF